MKRLTLYFLALVAIWTVAVAIDGVLESRAPTRVGFPGDTSIMFSGRALRVVSLGYDNALADYLFMKMIQYFAYCDDNHLPMTNMLPYTDAITDLDPGFAFAYRFTWNVLVNFDSRPLDIRAKEAGEILHKGWKYNPGDYRMAHSLAFHNFYYDDRLEEAANMYDRAFELRPFYLYPLLASRLRAKVGLLEVARDAIIQQFEETDDPKTKELLKERVLEITAEITARELEKYVEDYRQDHGRIFPDSLEQLVEEDYIQMIPPDGLGGTFIWNPEKLRIESTTLPNGRFDEPSFTGDYIPPWKKEENRTEEL